MKNFSVFILQLAICLLTIALALDAHHINSREFQRTKLSSARREQIGPGTQPPTLAERSDEMPTEGPRHRHGDPRQQSPSNDRPPAPDRLGTTEETPLVTGESQPGSPDLHVSENADNVYDLKASRIELIKRQILEKLRMSERPNVTSGESVILPRPLAFGDVHRNPAHDHHRPQMDDPDDYYYATTKQIILLGAHVETRAPRKPSASFVFTFSGKLRLENAKQAELWVYKKSNPIDGFKQNHTLIVTEPGEEEERERSKVGKVLAVEKTFRLKRGWVRFDMSHAVHHWFRHSREPQLNETKVTVTCKTCVTGSVHTPIETTGDRRPLLVIYTSKKRGRRTKRSPANCQPDTTECCMEPFEVSFAEIGWSDWIYQPATYEANYCKGNCDASLVMAGLSRTHHSSVMMSVGSMPSHQDRREDLLPCCSASRMSGVSLLYRDDQGTLLKTDLPNMKVEVCGCA